MKNYQCLMYHGIGVSGNKYTLKKDAFIAQLTRIKQEQLVGRSIEELNNGHENSKIVAITFDDGLMSNLWAAEKLLEFDFRATFFVVKDFINSNNSNFMDTSHIKTIANMGHSIGVHGKDHEWWTAKAPKVLVNELSDTKKWLEELTGRHIVSCSAPGGKINNIIINSLQKSGKFKFLRNSMPWFTEMNSFEVNATAILNTDSEEVFLKKLRGNLNFYRYLSVRQKVKNYIKPWMGK